MVGAVVGKVEQRNQSIHLAKNLPHRVGRIQAAGVLYYVLATPLGTEY